MGDSHSHTHVLRSRRRSIDGSGGDIGLRERIGVNEPQQVAFVTVQRRHRPHPRKAHEGDSTMAEVLHAANRNQATLEREGKYLTFALAQEEYGLEILKVREIIGYMNVTAVPQTPHYVKGVINLRGQVIPVVDLRAKFGMETAAITDQTCIIVVETDHGQRKSSTGIIVDRVQEVLDIDGQNIENAPQFGVSVDTDFILGMAKVGESVKILLDIDRVLGGDVMNALGRAGDTGEDSTSGRDA
jgi:purine-binding chemotaxis protein CheW